MLLAVLLAGGAAVFQGARTSPPPIAKESPSRHHGLFGSTVVMCWHQAGDRVAEGQILVRLHAGELEDRATRAIDAFEKTPLETLDRGAALIDRVPPDEPAMFTSDPERLSRRPGNLCLAARPIADGRNGETPPSRGDRTKGRRGSRGPSRSVRPVGSPPSRTRCRRRVAQEGIEPRGSAVAIRRDDLDSRSPSRRSGRAERANSFARASDEHLGSLIDALSIAMARAALDNVSVKLGAGTVTALIGSNGAGKSTLFKVLCGLLRPLSGTVHVNGFALLKKRTEARQSIGYVAQQFGLYEDLTVEENIRFFAAAYGVKETSRTTELMAVLILTPHRRDQAGSLVLGWKQGWLSRLRWPMRRRCC